MLPGKPTRKLRLRPFLRGRHHPAGGAGPCFRILLAATGTPSAPFREQLV